MNSEDKKSFSEKNLLEIDLQKNEFKSQQIEIKRPVKQTKKMRPDTYVQTPFPHEKNYFL